MAIDYFKATEKYLYNYRSLKANIDIMKLKIKELEEILPVGISGINYEREKIGETYAFRSGPEKEALNRVEKIEILEGKIQMTEYTVRKIEKAVEVLPVLEKRIVNLKYFSDERFTWRQIGNIVKYSPDYCKKELRRQAIEKISVSLFGSEAIKTPLLPHTKNEKDVI